LSVHKWSVMAEIAHNRMNGKSRSRRRRAIDDFKHYEILIS